MAGGRRWRWRQRCQRNRLLHWTSWCILLFISRWWAHIWIDSHSDFSCALWQCGGGSLLSCVSVRVPAITFVLDFRLFLLCGGLSSHCIYESYAIYPERQRTDNINVEMEGNLWWNRLVSSLVKCLTISVREWEWVLCVLLYEFVCRRCVSEATIESSK